MDLTVRNRAADATRPPVVTPPGATLRAVAHQLWEQGVGAAAVVDDEDRVIGIISERDLVARLAQGGDAEGPDRAVRDTPGTSCDRSPTAAIPARPWSPRR